MRLARFLAPGHSNPAVGVIDDDDNVMEVHGSGGDVGTLLLLDKEGLGKVACTSLRTHKLDDVRLLPPVGRPGKIFALAGNYHPHDSLRDVNVDVEIPKFFIKPITALIGHGDDIPNTQGKGTINTVEEIELGVVIGKPGKDVSLEDAMDHVFGYTIINDFSGRDLNLSPDREAAQDPHGEDWFEWLNGKWLDGFCPVGPWIRLAEDVGDPTNLQVTTLVNGDVRVDGNTSRMLFDIPRQIAYISKLTTLEPGDMIATGVVPLAPGTDDEIFIQPGDLVEGVVEGVGKLSNRVAS
jgi:2-keto-4-pentenoate hydratase/2-oxohepta-3-ene-1,7-dioic acid hydratase in catechol pathway